jgi:hypothetical protein
MVPNPRIWQRAKRPWVVCHGLLRCTECGVRWNRDVNGSRNIRMIGQAAMHGLPRPVHLRRRGAVALAYGAARQATLAAAAAAAAQEVDAPDPIDVDLVSDDEDEGDIVVY